MHTKDIMIGVVIGAIVFGAGGFIVGKKISASPARQFTGEFRGAPGQGGGARNTGGGFIGGEILSVDETSMTIKMQNGSTKIVLLGESSQITKSAGGSADDLVSGANVVVTGTENADGSMTAQTVQIRPASAPGATPRTTQ